MRAIHTDVFSVKPCCPGIAKWDRREASVSRFVYIDSEEELPEHPTAAEMTYGYILDGEIYVYVESGGDTLEGRYQNCGTFSGNLYDTTGQNEDGSMTQKAATDALTQKVDVSRLAPLTTAETVALLDL